MGVGSFGKTLPEHERVGSSVEGGTIVAMARRQFPEMAPQLKEFERSSREQRALAADIDRLQERKDRTKKARATLATEIRDHIPKTPSIR